MNDELERLIKLRDELSAHILAIVEQNAHADWRKYQVSPDLLISRRDALNELILEIQDDELYRFGREVKRRIAEAYDRQIMRDAARLRSEAEESFAKIEHIFGRKREQNT